MADSGSGDATTSAWGPPSPLAQALLGGWDTLAEALSVGPGPEERQALREAKCFAAAMVWSLLQLPPATLPPPQGRPVVVWVVGARSLMEGRLALDGEWKLLAEAFPGTQWELVLVGPEMDGTGDLAPADGGDGKVQARSVRLKGHEWARQSPPKPDFAVCFNSGVGTLAIALARHWLETVEELLKLDVPVLFTCFGEKERKGEEFIIHQLFKARVLLGSRENPLKPMPVDKPVGYRKMANLPANVDAVERDDETRICNTMLWWVQGSELGPGELHEVATVSGQDALKQLTCSFALQGAWKGWLEALKTGSKEVGVIALESFAASSENATVAKALTKIAKHVIEAIVVYTRRHGVNPEARPCIERLMFAKVRAQLGPDMDDATILDSVQRTVDEEHGELLPRQES